jgi:myo-inositol-1(or 4)-monophosphatase
MDDALGGLRGSIEALSSAAKRTQSARRRYGPDVPTDDTELAIEAVEAGAAVVLAGYGAEHARLAKSDTDFATETDLEAERAIGAVLRTARPGDAVIGEELGGSGSTDARRRWLVDPLCGTLNFAASTPLVAVNVALVADGDVSVAASADPIAGETFWTDGRTAHVRRGGIDRPLFPSSASGLVEINADRPVGGISVSAHLVTDVAFRGQFSPRVLSTTLGVAWVAAGRRAAYVSDGTFVEDLHFAAGLAIAKAAGCVITSFEGGSINEGDGVVISASDAIHLAVLEYLAPYVERLQ